MKGKRINYSDAELAWVQVYSNLPRAELHREFVARFGRADVSQANLSALCKRMGWLTGRDGRFAKGTAPPNKGKKGTCAPGSEKGWFRKGERRGVANTLYKPIGTERRTKDGYLERKVNDDLPLQQRWRAVHLIEWERLHGPVPEGHCLKCLDGNRGNADPANWIAVPRALLPRLTGRWRSIPYDSAPAELKPILLAAARVEHAAREAKRRRKLARSRT